MPLFLKLGHKMRKSSQAKEEEADEWLSHAINVAKITATAGKSVPVVGSSIQGAVGAFIAVLEPLKVSSIV